MIIFYDNNYPLLVLDIKDFLEIDYKILKKHIEYILNLSNEKKTYINLYIDLYDLTNYSMLYIGYIIDYISYINKNKLKYINKITIFINEKNNTIFINTIKYINKGISLIPINIKKIGEKKIWK